MPHLDVPCRATDRLRKFLHNVKQHNSLSLSLPLPLRLSLSLSHPLPISCYLSLSCTLSGWICPYVVPEPESGRCCELIFQTNWNDVNSQRYRRRNNIVRCRHDVRNVPTHCRKFAFHFSIEWAKIFSRSTRPILIEFSVSKKWKINKK